MFQSSRDSIYIAASSVSRVRPDLFTAEHITYSFDKELLVENITCIVDISIFFNFAGLENHRKQVQGLGSLCISLARSSKAHRHHDGPLSQRTAHSELLIAPITNNTPRFSTVGPWGEIGARV